MKSAGLASPLVRLTILAALLILVGIAALLVGAVPFPPGAILRLKGPEAVILWELRLPRVCLAGLVGATLAMSGLTYQTILRNGLADPFLLGISGGTGAAAAVATSLGLAHIPLALPAVSFGGALLATGIVIILSRFGGRLDTDRLILAGLVMNAFCSAVILLAISLSSTSDMGLAVRWMMGGFFSGSWLDVTVVGISAVAAMVTLAFMAGDVRMLEFGQDDARSKGIDPDRVAMIALVASSLATGAAVSVSGIIGFVGLLVPHLVRSIWRSDYRMLLPLSALAGAVLLIAADAASRVVIAPSELPVGVLTALLGVPFFIVLLRRASRS